MRTPSFYVEAAAFYLGAAAFVGFFFLVVLLAGCGTADAPAASADAEAERNLAAMQRVYDAFNTGNVALLDSAIALAVVEHQPLPVPITGREDLKAFVTMMRTAFPDLTVTVDEQFAASDKVVAVTTLRGTHQGEFMGIAPTGRAIEVGGIDVVRFEDGLGVEHWGFGDDLGMMQQLGVIPMPEAPADTTRTDTAHADA
jgi:steroid delta-isomerase-like uncharacterized protein